MKGARLYTALLFITFSFTAAAQTGVISGIIVDGKTGETLIGATVTIDGNTSLGAATDLDGKFTIAKVPVGKQKVRVRYMGYKEREEEVTVKPDAVTNVNLTLFEDNVNLQEVVVTATVQRRDNESAVVVMQKNSTVMQSGISSEEIKRTPDRNSGEVIRRVSGSTIQDGKFAIIRGLADRYNIAMLNNTILPSTEPDRKAFAFDVFPANILDNIIVIKTGQPNLPSEWAGGIIQLNSRDIPEKSFINLTIGQSFVEGTTFRPYKTYQGAKTDFLGFDNSVRKLPKDFPDIVQLNDIKLDGVNGPARLVQLGRQLHNNSWRVTERPLAYPGQSLQLSGGFAERKKDIQVGGVFALSYSNGLRFAEGTRTRIDADGSIYSDYVDERHNNSVTAAALGSLGLIFKNNHKIIWRNIYTVNADDNVFLRKGVSYFSATEQRRVSLEFTSSRVFNTTLTGEHLFANRYKWRWNAGFIQVNREQPKTLRYSYERFYTSADTTPYGPNAFTGDFFYQIQNGGSDPKLSALFYSDLRERVYNAGTDFTVPFEIKNNKQSVTVGYYLQRRHRDFNARNLFFDYTSSAYGNDSMFFDPNVDNIINQQNFDNGKLTLNQVAFPSDLYTADATTHAAFVMAENNIGSRFKAVWGFRFEHFRQDLTSPAQIDFDIIPDPEGGPPQIKSKLVDTTYTKKYLSGPYTADTLGNVKVKFPLLPSVNLIYKLTEEMNLRASYSQSMSRPEFREVSPFVYYDFVRDVNLTGNVNLLQTFIHNADLRWEWFMGRGQMFSIGAFYKNFTNTIELNAIGAGGVPQFVYNNAQRAYLVGGELELRKNFAFAHPKLEDLVFTTNLAYIYSRVDLRNVKNNAGEEQKRGMQGQSPYIINLGFSYLHPKIRTGATILYNHAGHRLYAIGEVGNPSWYEHWRPLLDLQLIQKLWNDKITIRFTVSDIIARRSIFYQNYVPDKERYYQRGKDNIVLSEKNYRTYTLNVSFNF
ncbi:MAG: TonB-dependent receptor [Chitinophagales bacterium]|nr:TonB-dependent receptor [Chitinophagales bacterium]MDW8419622.1 TonB-dependent receptor [Chitinophagales bacterium]